MVWGKRGGEENLFWGTVYVKPPPVRGNEKDLGKSI